MNVKVVSVVQFDPLNWVAVDPSVWVAGNDFDWLYSKVTDEVTS